MWLQHPQTQFPDGLSHIWLSWRWENLKRTLKALYHPRNLYAVHLDLEASADERLEVAKFVKSEPLFKKVGKVRMVTYRVPTMVTNTLHAASILFKEGGDWDWFINLSASDYPFVTQDGMPKTCFTHYQLSQETLFLSSIPVYQRARPVIIDPGLYSRQKSDVFWVSEKRSVPTAYRLLTDENLHISAAVCSQ